MNKSNYLSKSTLLTAVMIFVIKAPGLFASEPDSLKKIDLSAHHEIFEGKYIPISVDAMPKSPAYRYEGSSYFTTQVNVSAEGENIVGDAANEPSIAIDPTDPDKMVIGWRQFNTVDNSFRQAGYAYTLDGGDTWTFPGVIEPGIFRSDPVLGADADGNIFYNSLTVSGNNYYCNVYKMEPGSEDWDLGTYAYGGDKQWMAVDKTESDGNGNIYAFWTSNFSICYPNFFTRSVDGNESYEDCVYISGSPFWGTLTTGPDGYLYTAGYSNAANGFIMVRSTTAQDSQNPVTWDSYVSVDLQGDVAIGQGSGPNPEGLLGQVWIDIDRSNGPNSGNIYMLCSVQPYSSSDPADVMFTRSTDGGQTWDDPVRVNQDASTYNWQWFGTMSVAPDGRIDVVWLDTRDGTPGTYESSLYYAYSIDGGETFSENERISEAFNPHVGWPQQDKMGDYFHMISDIDYANLAWANTLNGEQDVYYTRISPWFVGVEENTVDDKMLINVYPNPIKGPLTVRYRLNKRSDVNISIFDMIGKVVYQKSISDVEYGTKVERLNEMNLAKGVYTLQLTASGKIATSKLIVSD